MENYISLNIKYLREKHKVAQKALSEIIGKKNASSIGHYESGSVIPPVDEVIKLCDFFKVEIQDFILTDLKSQNDFKSNGFSIQVAHGNANKQSISAEPIEIYLQIIQEKNKEIEYLRKLLEKKI
jgi:transcriptional regulator with XRE-family HTH domain